MYQTILVPLDGSKRAESILPHVEEIVRSSRGRIILLTSVEQRIYFSTEGMPTSVDREELEDRLNRADAYLKGLQEEFRLKDIQAEFLVINQPAVEAINNVAEESGADLIAMASHGRSGLKRVFYGSVAAGVLQRVDRPLLIVRSRDEAGD